MNATVSVIIPVYNGQRFLRPAIESALNQTHQPLEVIIVDDGSTDGSAEIAESLPVIYAHQANQGPSTARNAGAGRSAGGFLAFLDQDDLWRPHKLAAQLDALQANPWAGYALCHMRYLLDADASPPSWFHRKGPTEGEPGFAPSCWLVRRSAWEKVGPFHPERRYAQDIDWLARANDLGIQAVMVPETLVLKRVHERNLVASIDAAKREILTSLKDSVARKRTLRQRG